MEFSEISNSATHLASHATRKDSAECVDSESSLGASSNQRTTPETTTPRSSHDCAEDEQAFEL